MEVLTLNATPRKNLGKAATKAVRNADLVPCVLYGGSENLHFTVVPLDLRSLIYSPEFKVVEINLEGETHRCIIKSAQFHPVTDKVVHIDFLRLIDNHKVKVDIPISFEGVAVGIKEGGKLIKKLRKVSIKTVPEKLIDKIILNTTKMKLGESLRIKDLEISEGVEVLNNGNIPIATIEIPRALRGLDAKSGEAETEEGAAEGETAEAAEATS
jgi:large subunit ribosomal protein L25